MNKSNWTGIVAPHLIAIGIFVALTYAYLFPILKGMELAQHDVVQAMAMQHEIRSHLDKTGEFSLWTGSMFSGMPVYQIWMQYPLNLFSYLVYFFINVFPGAGEQVFLLMFGFYILMFAITRNPWIAIISAIAFAFSSYNFINIDAGHTTKVRCTAYLAPIIAGVILAYNGRYLVGSALATLFLAMQVRANHFQITYYTFITAGILAVYFLVQAVRQKQIPTFLKGTAALVIAAILAVGSATAQLWTTYEYSKETIRGGNSELDKNQENSKTGLDKDYAFSWSYGKLESFTLLIPNFMGGASQQALGTDSELYKDLIKKGVPKMQAEKISEQAPTYWGDQPFTSGPTYYGAITCFLFLFGMFLIRDPIKWAFLALAVLSVLLSWGKNFEFFNDLFFNYFPMYNKFRTPAMILTLGNVAFVFIAGLSIQEVLGGERGKNEILAALKKALGITLVLVAVIGIIGSYMYDYSASVDAQLEKSGWPVKALQADRAGIMRADAFRSLVFIGLAGLLIWGFIENKVKKSYFLTGLALLVLVDLWTVAKRYLNDSDFVTASGYEQLFRPSKTDLQILQDKDPDYRVLNLSTNTFNDAMTSYFHKSIGGYHAAKLRRYQDLIEHQISKNMSALNQGLGNDNIPVLNMLNMKYIITSKDNVVKNPNAMGNAWFVPSYQIVNGAEEEMNALDHFDPAEVAFVDKKFEDYLSGWTPQSDPDASITLTEYAPNHLTYQSNSSSEQLAVFSEVYYDDSKGWEAYIDGQRSRHIRADYVLRAMRIPAGQHIIEFKFHPKSYYLGEKISLGFSVFGLLGILLVFLREATRAISGASDKRE